MKKETKRSVALSLLNGVKRHIYLLVTFICTVFLCTGSLFANEVSAQDGKITVKGRVMDNKEPVPGAVVFIKGTSIAPD